MILQTERATSNRRPVGEVNGLIHFSTSPFKH